MRRFLTPGWALGFIAAVLFTVACFWFFAPWQLGKNEQLNARNDRLTEATQAPPKPLDEAQGTPDPASIDWHLVTATGSFDTAAEHQVLVRLRPVDGTQVYQVLVPFRADNGTTVMVNRGWVPVGPGGEVPAIEPLPRGEVTITGRWRMPEAEDPEPTDVHGYTTVKTFNVEQINALPQLAGVDFAPQYLVLTGGQPGVLGELPTPGIEDGPYLSYGLQWIAFGIIVPLALIYFVVSEVRNRRRATVLSAPAVVASDSTAAPSSSADEPTAAAADSPGDTARAQETGSHTGTEDVLASRYGSSHQSSERRRIRRSRSRL